MVSQDRRCDFRADLLSGLSDNLDELGQREPEQLVTVEVSAGPVGAAADGLGRGLGGVPNAAVSSAA